MRNLFHLSLVLLFVIGVDSNASAQSQSRPSGGGGIQLGTGSATRQPATAGSATKPQATAGSATKGSASKGQASMGSETKGSMTKGSDNRNGQAALAMRGHCPVCIVEMKKWVPGVPAHKAVYDGKMYYFPEDKQLQMFLQNPTKYVPALGGDCIVCYAKSGDRMAGNLNSGSMYRGRVYLFPSEAQRAEFRANPAAYADADLALGGNCAVCRVEMNQNMRGVKEFTTIHNGMRYLFPGKQQLDMFLTNPAKYAAK